ncbi:hypothetical protein AV530_001577 [Patagioenas fasciata monilis]|uniref:Neuronal acetylcholine receptor subunit alpha-7 n=1 Tax=Patagioenas fasciata monilis TaxID=372326 RepID=A0A1V4K5G3_PATFA|nr:hypothetical protein AV530_001577 [Patagioenas fasciata monilis]
MMMNYSGLVSCDAVTYTASWLSTYYFKKLLEKNMKGFSKTGPVYEYVRITKKCIFGIGLTKKRSEYGPFMVSQQGESQRRLYRELLKNYNRLERPVVNDSQPLVVELQLSLLQIIDVYWVDVYLSWDQYEYPGVQNLRFPVDQIWVPDILLYNSGWLIDLQMLEADISNYISNGEWDLVGVPGKRNEKYYECCREPYPDVTYTITMRRRTLYYGLNLLIPCVLISGLALLVFLLPADSGEKISLGITVLLSLTVFMLLVAEIMPATSDSVPLIAQYFASIMVIVGLSVVVTVLVLQFHHHDPLAGKMPKWESLQKESLQAQISDKTSEDQFTGRKTLDALSGVSSFDYFDKKYIGYNMPCTW